MINRQAAMSLHRIFVIAFAMLLAAVGVFTLASISAPGADARQPRVSLRITTANQATLLRQNRLNVRVRSNARARVNLSASYSGRSNVFQRRTVSFGRRGGNRVVQLRLTNQGRRQLSLCGAKRVRATGRFSGRQARTTRNLGRDASRCITVPLGANPERCDFLDTTVCMQPFPNDLFTKEAGTATGRQLNFVRESMPANSEPNKPPVHIDPTDMNRADGFSPGNLAVLKVPGLDTPQAFTNSKIVPITNMNAYDDPNQAVMVIDAKTGERHPIWAELDSNPTSVDPGPGGPGGVDKNPGNTGPVNLIIRPAVNYEHGHRYIVVLRNLRDASNKPIASPPAFRTYRDSIITKQPIVEQRRSHMNSIINTVVNKAGVKRSSLYMAWDFTVASAPTTTGRALTIRDDAFARLGDNNLANRVIEGNSPTWAIDSVTADNPTGNNLRRIRGRLTNVPCYISSPNCSPGGTFQFDANDKLIWNPSSTTQVPFECRIPRSVLERSPGSVTPAQTGTYGHGLLGSYTQVGGQDRVGYDGNTVWCAVDWAGFSDLDSGSVLAALADMSNFPMLVDRMQQGFVNFLYLQRALVHPNGMATDPSFQVDPDGPGGVPASSAINTSLGANTRGQYMGISQGGIMGGALTALSPDADYGVLGVPGINYSTLLRRSVDSDDYFKNPTIGLYKYYPNESDRMLLLSLVQLLWDRGEGNGYAHFVTDNALPNTPPHQVLMRVAFGDHQVANVTAEVAARTFGAKVYFPALQPGRHWDVDPFLGLPKASTFPWKDGSIMVYYDGGPVNFNGRQRQGAAPPPIGNVPPRKEWGYGDDPHGMPRASASGVRHAVTFLNGPTLALGDTRGTIESCDITGAGDYFAGSPGPPLTPIPPPVAGDKRCYANGWNGFTTNAP
jgi:hypothetical protein